MRETYAVGDDRLLLVATDRLSAFDVVFDQPIPDKGRLLTALSACWFERLADLGPTHFISADARGPAGGGRTRRSSPDARCWRAGRERIDAECVVRGYLAGSGWAEYQRSGEVVGHQLPDGLREADRLPEPIFTPSTKAEVGHDENITREQLAEMVGAELARQLEERSLALYRAGAELASAGRPDPGRHQVRVRLDRRPGGADRRAAHPGLEPLLGRGPLRARRAPAELRQAVRARLRGGVGLEQGAAGARACRTR